MGQLGGNNLTSARSDHGRTNKPGGKGEGGGEDEVMSSRNGKSRHRGEDRRVFCRYTSWFLLVVRANKIHGVPFKGQKEALAHKFVLWR